MEWTQVLTMVLSIGGMIFGGVAYIHSDVKEIRKEMKEGLQQQSLRSDRLYEMFIDLLKNK